MASIRKVSDFLKIVGQKVDLETKQNGRFCGKLYDISDSCKHLILHDVVHISPKGKSVNGFLAKHLK
ncbi:MAG: hypothetical protein HEQ20_27170 [Aphanizomenon flos-aquae KM1D3_PB]|uniref:hypothetical protein n=1 Tax=Aphanizomenon flos-aquae TaxID=1176 RepID=UPI000542EE0A|nr:hypothetical protein [Aphanizomenon flos-aquae]KHG39109.1 hypothetical protein OA07_25630 [Aphanizomenon flos-aquae 2012/KM1/D3]KHG42950.1 hypothetical protein OA07_01995 [Aphanizomenon flos-aquae 2012/KM1/D3]QSV73784.1 MAG: hypothetical protein HEQ20_27170 [Aphanizomenon flos-aquae KM1D3_PB]